MRFFIALIWIQSIYYIITGIWPVLHIESFIAITGPKQDIWLVQTFGVLIAAVGLSLLVSGIRKEFTYSVAAVGSLVALGITVCELYFVFTGTIPEVYLLDVVAELVFMFNWWVLFPKNIKGKA